MVSSNTTLEGVNSQLVQKEKQFGSTMFYMAVVTIISLALGFAGGFVAGSSANNTDQQISYVN